MSLARVVTGVIAVLVAVLALAPLPASAGTQVYSSKMVCAAVNLGEPMVTLSPVPGPSIVQTGGTGTSSLATTPADVQVKITMSGLPGNSPVACLVACVVDGALDLFNLQVFEPCNANTSAAGKFNFSANIPLIDLNGGCLVPVVAIAVEPEEGPLVVCAPGFGQFEPFAPPVCTSEVAPC